MGSQLQNTEASTPVVQISVNHREKLIGLNSPQDEDLAVIHGAVIAITNVALLSRKVLHINVAYNPETDGLEVRVYNANANYFGAHNPIFTRSVYLDRASSLLQLHALEDDLIELVADAKDKLVGAV